MVIRNVFLFKPEIGCSLINLWRRWSNFLHGEEDAGWRSVMFVESWRGVHKSISLRSPKLVNYRHFSLCYRLTNQAARKEVRNHWPEKSQIQEPIYSLSVVHKKDVSACTHVRARKHAHAISLTHTYLCTHVHARPNVYAQTQVHTHKMLYSWKYLLKCSQKYLRKYYRKYLRKYISKIFMKILQKNFRSKRG